MKRFLEAWEILLSSLSYLTYWLMLSIGLTFLLAVMVDGYFQIKETHSWKPTDWELTVWTTALAANGLYVLKNKK